MSDDVRVRGGATAEELAVVLALVRRPREARPDAFARWRATRLAALRDARGGR
ncbi:MAG TPA: hypothetical protein VGN18_05115 [Jatrophihabitans sp.]|jgi:hypothetical protein|uniref:hypothetical protein n=1 Tax=Jatrophihabitans sp. TaxID=1932789 RepID=UPI002E069611|nr:hypothetical protein [Jatrophihabitans sp.]